MFKKLVLIAVVLTALLVTATPAYAQSGSYYVDTNYQGTTESGTPAQPFKTLDKAIAAAQANPYGGNVYIKQPNGRWMRYGYIDSVNPPGTGVPLASPALLVLLVLVSLILVTAGWFLMRRSRTLPSRV
jgi:hypothetical protein